MISVEQNGRIHKTNPRETIHVTFTNGLVLEGPKGTSIEAFLNTAHNIDPINHGSFNAGGILNERLRELSYAVTVDSTLTAVPLASSDGRRIYRRTLVMVLAVAVSELWPNTRVTVRYAVPDNGFYCTLSNREPFTLDEIMLLEHHIQQIIGDDSAITKRVVTLHEAITLFSTRSEDDKVRLLEERTRNDLTLYTLRGRDDYYYGYMMPSTGYVGHFSLSLAGEGFILQYPSTEDALQITPMRGSPKIVQVFEEADDWLQKLEVEDIGRLNQVVRSGKIDELMLVSEALHEQRVAAIAHEINAGHLNFGTRVVLIAGPSSSGKTTFAKRLAIQLLAHGLRPYTLELDNYFVDREFTPRDETGEYDFESIGALNLKLFNQHLLGLINGEEVQLPRFDFVAGRSLPGKHAMLRSNQIIILEGIHGLNPELVPNIPSEAIYRVYVSALTQLNVDAHNRVPTTDVRVLRRIVRDARTRGYNATNTLNRWPSVRRGEKRNIFPYQENADVMFNSALIYELAAMRSLVEPLLLQVAQGTPAHIEANRLLSFLRWVHPLNDDQRARIPDNSLLREFIGGSNLENYHPGE